MNYTDEHFRQFATNLERAIEKYGGVEEITLVKRQKKQIETLVALEKKFRKTLIQHPWGPGVYQSFMNMIMDDLGNILDARPFFRERQDVFIERIIKALRSRKARALYPFNINYQFVNFVMNSRDWRGSRIGSKIVKLAEKITALRTEIIEMNMPLAVSRARIFWSRTPRSHLSYMDLVQISCEGLMSAVDKFVLPYSKVFRSVAIGRIVGNFIENYSETLIHFYPQDKRKIYRANKSLGKQTERGLGMVDFDSLVDDVNNGVDNGQKTNTSEIAGLLAAASHVSSDTTPPEVTENSKESSPLQMVNKYAASEDWQPDNRYEFVESRNVLNEAYAKLTTMERKLLRMKGIDLEIDPIAYMDMYPDESEVAI